jgi:hypothetical protein
MARTMQIELGKWLSLNWSPMSEVIPKARDLTSGPRDLP